MTTVVTATLQKQVRDGIKQELTRMNDELTTKELLHNLYTL